MKRRTLRCPICDLKSQVNLEDDQSSHRCKGCSRVVRVLESKVIDKAEKEAKAASNG